MVTLAHASKYHQRPYKRGFAWFPVKAWGWPSGQRWIWLTPYSFMDCPLCGRIRQALR